MTARHDWFDVAAIGASGAGPPTAHDVAMRMLAFSAARVAAFAPFDFPINDIVWDLLLGLFVARERGLQIDLGTLCATVPQPASVSVRWLRALRSNGMVDYREDEGARADVRLTTAVAAALRALIER